MMALLETLERYLVPPGEGVYTVSSASHYKQTLHTTLYGTTGPSVSTQWKKTLGTWPNARPCLLGLCCDSGGGILRGANWGPLFIRNALYQRIPPASLTDLGDVRIIPQLLLDDYHSQPLLEQCRRALYGAIHPAYPVSPLSITEEVISTLLAHQPQQTFLGLGGDHSMSYGLLKPYLKSKRSQKIRTALIHFDAHTDLLNERLGIPICFGSWTAHILGLLEEPALLIQLGIRTSKKQKTEWEHSLGIKQYWADEMNNTSPARLAEQLITHLTAHEAQELYITVDIDALDHSEAGATGTPEPGGLSTETVLTIIQRLAQSFKISGADLMEVAPFNIPLECPNRAAEPERTLTNAARIAECLVDVL